MARSILIVDDEFGLADIASEILADAGYDVAIAINGKQGLVALATKRADLVMLDVMMPVMDGPEMLRQMKQDPQLAAVPVIMMTALPEAVPQGTPHDALLIKPFSPDVMLETVARLLLER